VALPVARQQWSEHQPGRTAAARSNSRGSIAHLLFVPNWLVGPAYLLSFGIFYMFGVGREEQMMLDRFGSKYQTYMRHSGRLIFWLRQPAENVDA
jgi:protein-S-isoprenylcysteine O-methyltransferase Ste14